MKKTVLKGLAVLLCGIICITCLCGYAAADEGQLTAANISIQQVDSNAKMHKYAKADGYKNVKKWYKKFKKVRKSKIKSINNQIKTYRSFMTESELNKAKWYKEKLKQVKTIKRLKEVKIKANLFFKKIRLRKEAQEAEQAYWESFDGKSHHEETITAWGGVYYYGGRLETYYSSNVLYHYMTPEWICDEEGFWRTSEGYYVVAASDMAYGTIFEGSKGWCMVLDSGCGYGVTDYYVCW